MKTYNLRFIKTESTRHIEASNYRSGDVRRQTNKRFRKTGKNLVEYDPDTIVVFNYKQRHQFDW